MIEMAGTHGCEFKPSVSTQQDYCGKVVCLDIGFHIVSLQLIFILPNYLDAFFQRLYFCHSRRYFHLHNNNKFQILVQKTSQLADHSQEIMMGNLLYSPLIYYLMCSSNSGIKSSFHLLHFFLLFCSLHLRLNITVGGC